MNWFLKDVEKVITDGERRKDKGVTGCIVMMYL